MDGAVRVPPASPNCSSTSPCAGKTPSVAKPYHQALCTMSLLYDACPVATDDRLPVTDCTVLQGHHDEVRDSTSSFNLYVIFGFVIPSVDD